MYAACILANVRRPQRSEYFCALIPMGKLTKFHAPPAPMYNLDSKAAADLDFTRAALWRRMDASMGRKALSIPSMNKQRGLL